MSRFAVRSSRIARRLKRRGRLSSNAEGGKGKETPVAHVVAKETTTTPMKNNPALDAVKPLKEVPPPPPPPKQPQAEQPPLTNPFPLLAHATENIDLSSRLRAFSNNFAVIGALWCTLSISALSQPPIDDVYKDTERIENNAKPVLAAAQQQQPVSMIRLRRANTSLQHVVVPSAKPSPPANNDNNNAPRRKRQPILVKYCGLSEALLEDIYMASWSASFFISAIGLGLSTVVAGIVAATAPAYVKIFVRRHSDILLALPVCQGLSSGFAAVGLAVGLDEARGEPVSWIGYIGTVAGAAIVGNSAMKVLKGYKASRAAGKLSIPPKDV